jgi:hypothetical protein
MKTLESPTAPKVIGDGKVGHRPAVSRSRYHSVSSAQAGLVLHLLQTRTGLFQAALFGQPPLASLLLSASFLS